MCLTYLPIELDDTGQYIPCTTCGYAEWVAPSAAGTKSIPATAVPVSFSAPATLDRVIKLQAAPGQVAEYEPGPVVARRLPPPLPRETYAPKHSTLDAVVTYQVNHGQRDKPRQNIVYLSAELSRLCPIG